VIKILAVDIAGMGDWTALVGVESHGDPPRHYRVPLLDRWHAKYLDTADKVAAVANLTEWGSATLAIDATGVGRPVLEAIQERLPARSIYGITFTAGSQVTPGARSSDLRVPKKDLVGAAQLLFQTGRIKINPELPHADTLAKELVAYTVRSLPMPTSRSRSAGRGRTTTWSAPWRWPPGWASGSRGARTGTGTTRRRGGGPSCQTSGYRYKFHSQELEGALSHPLDALDHLQTVNLTRRVPSGIRWVEPQVPRPPVHNRPLMLPSGRVKV
jgi:hypothetical protein